MNYLAHQRINLRNENTFKLVFNGYADVTVTETSTMKDTGIVIFNGKELLVEKLLGYEYNTWKAWVE